MKWPVRMRLRAERHGKPVVLVEVHRDRDAMQRAIKEDGRSACYRTEGFCASFWAKSYAKGKATTPWRWGCRVYLYAGGAGSGVVSHELTHAALFYCTRSRKTDRISFRRLNERLAWTQGWLVHQYWQAYYRKPKAVQRALKK